MEKWSETGRGDCPSPPEELPTLKDSPPTSTSARPGSGVARGVLPLFFSMSFFHITTAVAAAGPGEGRGPAPHDVVADHFPHISTIRYEVPLTDFWDVFCPLFSFLTKFHHLFCFLSVVVEEEEEKKEEEEELLHKISKVYREDEQHGFKGD